ncbi:MAG TPA: TlpA disulfide reductase family protein [Acidimicrobiales bacterium]|nr:TlpA disulfide reductase family protein [Acidimicrobiales bacterium]
MSAVAAPPSPPPAAAGRRRHTARWVAAVVLLALVVVAIVAATRPSYQATQESSPLTGHSAPPFAGRTLQHGRALSLADYRGRYLFVNFFASWCPPCVSEAPDLARFAAQQRARGAAGAAMVSIVFNDSVSAATGFVRRSHQQWPAIPDRGGSVANAYGVGSPPMTFLVGPDGRVVGDPLVGPATEQQLDNMLAAATAGRHG